MYMPLTIDYRFLPAIHRSEMGTALGKLQDTLAQLAQAQKTGLISDLQIKTASVKGQIATAHANAKRRTQDLSDRVQKLVEKAQKRTGDLQAQLETLKVNEPRETAAVGARIAELQAKAEEIKGKQTGDQAATVARLNEVEQQVMAAKQGEQALAGMSDQLKTLMASLDAFSVVHAGHLDEANKGLDQVDELRGRAKNRLNLELLKILNGINEERRVREWAQLLQSRDLDNLRKDMRTINRTLVTKQAAPPQKGPQGYPGPEGPEGPPGEVGVQGFKGVYGERGQPGERGVPGLEGDQGEKGRPGATGQIGPPGGEGPAGVQGNAGPRGATGQRGAIGERGPIGPAGAEGDAGSAGSAGIAGDVGDDGLVGSRGQPGSQGAPGEDGRDVRAAAAMARQGGTRLKAAFGGVKI